MFREIIQWFLQNIIQELEGKREEDSTIEGKIVKNKREVEN
jgi:hypothetical protein